MGRGGEPNDVPVDEEEGRVEGGGRRVVIAVIAV